jgi:hypothetical protein
LDFLSLALLQNYTLKSIALIADATLSSEKSAANLHVTSRTGLFPCSGVSRYDCVEVFDAIIS